MINLFSKWILFIYRKMLACEEFLINLYSKATLLMAVNIGDVIATLIYLVFVILIIAFIFIAFNRLKNSTKEKQVINQKLDTILQKLN
ncbi:hypothetical protein [Lysinibacillus sphaericus]|uniref:hypothetical protein n=1 Tax=Lysinibacillus sphaericus TaxID=1421 RepID=UPI003D08665E